MRHKTNHLIGAVEYLQGMVYCVENHEQFDAAASFRDAALAMLGVDFHIVHVLPGELENTGARGYYDTQNKIIVVKEEVHPLYTVHHAVHELVHAYRFARSPGLAEKEHERFNFVESGVEDPEQQKKWDIFMHQEEVIVETAAHFILTKIMDFNADDVKTLTAPYATSHMKAVLMLGGDLDENNLRQESIDTFINMTESLSDFITTNCQQTDHHGNEVVELSTVLLKV